MPRALSDMILKLNSPMFLSVWCFLKKQIDSSERLKYNSFKTIIYDN